MLIINNNKMWTAYLELMAEVGSDFYHLVT